MLLALAAMTRSRWRIGSHAAEELPLAALIASHVRRHDGARRRGVAGRSSPGPWCCRCPPRSPPSPCRSARCRGSTQGALLGLFLVLVGVAAWRMGRRRAGDGSAQAPQPVRSASPRKYSRATSSPRLRTPTLPKIALRWSWTVRPRGSAGVQQEPPARGGADPGPGGRRGRPAVRDPARLAGDGPDGNREPVAAVDSGGPIRSSRRGGRVPQLRQPPLGRGVDGHDRVVPREREHADAPLGAGRRNRLRERRAPQPVGERIDDAGHERGVAHREVGPRARRAGASTRPTSCRRRPARRAARRPARAGAAARGGGGCGRGRRRSPRSARPRADRPARAPRTC